MDQQPTPENLHASEMQKLQYQLQALFVEWDPKLPGPWSVRRYVDGDKENVFDIRHAPETGVHVLGARIKNSSMPSRYEVIEDTLSSDGRFLVGHDVGETDKNYHELRARQFNELLARSTSKPYGWFGRMLMRMMRAQYRFAT